MKSLLISSTIFSILYFIFTIFRKTYYSKYSKQTFRIIWIILILKLLIPILRIGIKVPIQWNVITPISADMVNSLQRFQLPWNSFPHYFIKVWALGFILSISIVTIHYIYFRISLNRSLLGSNLELEKIVKDYNLPIEIRMTTQNVSPFVTGLFKKILVLPQYSTYIENQRDLDYMLQHEMTHIRKKDTFVKIIYLFARCIHWFNPLVYLMGKKFSVDIEMACDEVVAETLSKNEKKEYCNMLYKYCIYNNSINHLYSNALSHSSIKMKERFDSILNPSKKEGKSILIISCLLLVFVLIFVIVDFTPGYSKTMDSTLNHVKEEDILIQSDKQTDSQISSEVKVTITVQEVDGISHIFYKTLILRKDKIGN